MLKKGNDKPSPFMLAFFRWFCRGTNREDIEGDLLERFHYRLSVLGAGKARWLFVKDVMLLFMPGIMGKLRSQSSHNFFNMKNINWIKLAGLNLLVVLMIISPFAPGPSNKLVLAASILGQIAGVFGLLLVPIGVTWTVIEIRKLRKKNIPAKDSRLHYHLALGTAIFIVLILLVAVLVVPNPMPKISFLVGLAFTITGFTIALNQIRKWKENGEHVADHGASVILAASAASCMTFIYVFSSLFALVGIGIMQGILVLLFLPVGLYWVVKQIKKLKDAREKRFYRIPLYFVTIPLIAFLTLFFLVRPASDFSRSFAIKKSGELIASIEEFKNRTGQYPESIQDLFSVTGKKMPRPSIMGIGEFRYNKINDNYSLSFSQWLDLGSLEEIVLYDKNDLKNNLTGEFANYNYRIDLWRVKGAFSSHDTRYSNWRYYHVD